MTKLDEIIIQGIDYVKSIWHKSKPKPQKVNKSMFMDTNITEEPPIYVGHGSIYPASHEDRTFFLTGATSGNCMMTGLCLWESGNLWDATGVPQLSSGNQNTNSTVPR